MKDEVEAVLESIRPMLINDGGNVELVEGLRTPIGDSFNWALSEFVKTQHSAAEHVESGARVTRIILVNFASPQFRNRFR